MPPSLCIPACCSPPFGPTSGSNPTPVERSFYTVNHHPVNNVHDSRRAAGTLDYPQYPIQPSSAPLSEISNTQSFPLPWTPGENHNGLLGQFSASAQLVHASSRSFAGTANLAAPMAVKNVLDGFHSARSMLAGPAANSPATSNTEELTLASQVGCHAGPARLNLSLGPGDSGSSLPLDLISPSLSIAHNDLFSSITSIQHPYITPTFPDFLSCLNLYPHDLATYVPQSMPKSNGSLSSVDMCHPSLADFPKPMTTRRLDPSPRDVDANASRYMAMPKTSSSPSVDASAMSHVVLYLPESEDIRVNPFGDSPNIPSLKSHYFNIPFLETKVRYTSLLNLVLMHQDIRSALNTTVVS